MEKFRKWVLVRMNGVLKTKKFITIILSPAILIFTYSKLSAQTNLVLNPSLELYDSCPYNFSQINFASNWFQPLQPSGSTDYFNWCTSSSNVSTPINFFGYQVPKTGIAFGGFGVHSLSPNQREYIEVGLQASLQGGNRYCVSFYVSLADNSKYAINSMGLFFSNDSLFSSNFLYINQTPQILNANGILMDTLNWILISGTYIASGGERFITIGNFENDSNTQLDSVNLGGYPWAYYYIDDVSITLCEDTTNQEFFIPTAFSPNGDNNNDILHVRGPIKEMDFYIYDRWGELVYSAVGVTPSTVEGWDGKYKGQDLNSGVFVYYFRGSLLDGKEVTQKGNITLVR